MIPEEEKIKEFELLKEDGLSDAEARGTIWNEQNKYETKEYWEQFAKWMNFEKIKTVLIKDICVDENHDTIYVPMDKEEFLKNHFEEIDCWWEKTSGELFFEEVEQIVEEYEEKWEEFKEKVIPAFDKK